MRIGALLGLTTDAPRRPADRHSFDEVATAHAREVALLQAALTETRAQLDERDELADQELLGRIVVRISRLAEDIRECVAAADIARGDEHGVERPRHIRALVEVEQRIRAVLCDRPVEDLTEILG